MFQLTEKESKNIWFQIETKSKNIETRGGKYNKPYVFTEQGVAMLAAVLRTEVAEEISIKIMDAFVAMRHYISNNLLETKYINEMLLKHDNEIENNSKLENREKLNIQSFKTIIKILNDSSIHYMIFFIPIDIHGMIFQQEKNI